jgi:hypothetical protein
VTVVERITHIAAPPADVLGIMLDVTEHPSWQKEVQSVEVLAADDRGRPLSTRVTVAAMGQTATYSVAYTYGGGDSFAYHLIEGAVMTKNDFTFRATADGDGSRVEVSQEIDIKWPLPGFMKDQLALKGVKDMLKALTAKAEAAIASAERSHSHGRGSE